MASFGYAPGEQGRNEPAPSPGRHAAFKESATLVRTSADIEKARKRLMQTRSEAILTRAQNPQYHMGSYGTFGMDTIHGRLFELGVDIDSLKVHTMFYFVYVIVALAFWPIAAMFAIPVSYVAGKDRDLQVLKVLLVLSTSIGAFLWFVPLLIVGCGGGVDHFYRLIFEKKELNFLDFIDFFLSELMILLLIVFALVYHHIALDVESYKRSALESWRQHHGDYGVNVYFPPQQLNRMMRVLHEDCQGSLSARSGSSCRSTPRVDPVDDDDEAATTLHLEDIIRILEVLPGWDSYHPSLDFEVKDHHQHIRSVESGLFSELVALEDEAMEKNLWPIDIWLVKTQWYPEEEMGIMEGLLVAFSSTWDLLAMVWTFVCHHVTAFVVLTILAVVRTLLPRVWLWYGGGELFPREAHSAMLVVVFSSLVSFICSFFWLAVFFFILMEYRRNLCQVVLITGLVDAHMRVRYSQYFLMSMLWFRKGPKDSEDVLGKMPLLDLRVSSNAAAFWRLREYTMLDRANERMGISILLEIVIIWLILKFVATLITIYFSTSALPAVLVVTVFDLCVFGGMLLLSLICATDINSVMEEHKKVFVQAKYECTMAIGNVQQESAISRKPSLADGGRKSKFAEMTPEASNRGELDDKRKDLELSRKLLNEYLDMCVEGEYRDSILFGMHVTPAKIVSFAATVATMIYTLLQEAVRDGRLHVSEGVEDGFASGPALHAVHATVSSLLQFNATSHAFLK
mmetsp:Transcript_93796/g.146480  ORF Transcript_93796/g.146480 Transcript_93796/m.146480 type:complete len:741 (-) Transcript_93796:67-2289(-)